MTKVKCDCIHCQRKRITVKCRPGYPKMMFLNDGSVFNIAFFVSNDKEFNFIIDELSYILDR